jgi:hypothetical protein
MSRSANADGDQFRRLIRLQERLVARAVTNRA